MRVVVFYMRLIKSYTCNYLLVDMLMVNNEQFNTFIIRYLTYSMFSYIYHNLFNISVAFY